MIKNGDCIKEKEIEDLYKKDASNRDLLIELKTLVEKLVDYQIKESKAASADHEVRIKKLEQLENKIIAWASVGGVLGGMIFNLAVKYVR